jgi:hypothetical protein
MGDHNSWAPNVNNTPIRMTPEIGTSAPDIDQPIEDNRQDTDIDTDSTIHDHVGQVDTFIQMIAMYLTLVSFVLCTYYNL